MSKAERISISNCQLEFSGLVWGFSEVTENKRISLLIQMGPEESHGMLGFCGCLLRTEKIMTYDGVRFFLRRGRQQVPTCSSPVDVAMFFLSGHGQGALASTSELDAVSVRSKTCSDLGGP